MKQIQPIKEAYTKPELSIIPLELPLNLLLDLSLSSDVEDYTEGEWKDDY